MTAGKELRSCEVLKVLVVGHDVDRSRRTFEVVTPSFETFEDRKEFLVVRVVVQLRASQGAGVEGDRVEFVVGSEDGKDGSESIVGSVGFDDNLSIRYPMGENRSGSESFFESGKGFPAIVGKVPPF